MGVIKKTLFRRNILGTPRHRNLFLDMEENIHIHYRDLRIELSRGEFEEIASIFLKQSAELLQIIEEKNYQDGKLPNANQDDVRVWTESKLKHEVKYHPQRFSLEECGDGYHFHYRNFKLLIDPDEFRQIAQLFGRLDLDAPYASSCEEVVELLQDNEVDFTYDAGNLPGQVLALQVAYHHLPKIRDIFKYIGFSASDLETGQKAYSTDKLRVLVRLEKKRSALDYRYLRGLNGTVRLADHLPSAYSTLDPVELNLLKCQVLDLYCAVRNGEARNIDLDPHTWLYSATNRKVIFPYTHSASATNPKADAEVLYRNWAGIINGCQLGFIKPGKDVLPAEAQGRLRQQIEQALRHDVAPYIAVDKIWIMGSTVRGEMGVYRAPFIHGKLAKLGSDVDVLVEISADREADVPGFWELHAPEASNRCAVYHVAQIPLAGDTSTWTRQFPNISFIHHLIDAYVYLPSRGNRKEVDAFLKKFGAKLFYDRARDGTVMRSEEEKGIAAWLQEHYGIGILTVEKMRVSTENAIFKAVSSRQDYVLKLFKVSGNYHRDRIAEHTDYEAQLVTELASRGVATARVIFPSGMQTLRIDGYPALLFERIPGAVQQKPEYPLDRICESLAKIHRVQTESPLPLSQAFAFDDVCMTWLPLFEQYSSRGGFDDEIAKALVELKSVSAPCLPGENRTRWFARSPSLHNHGDVTPKNVIYGQNGPVTFFDFNNAFYGPRLADVVDGAYEFSLAEKYIQLADFTRFDLFIVNYSAAFPLSAEELEDLPHWTALIGIIKFSKELKTMLEKPKEALRRKRALAIAQFLIARCGKR